MLKDKNKYEAENVLRREPLLVSVASYMPLVEPNVFLTFQHSFATPRTSLPSGVRVKV
jgi:hypothetical protein